MRVIDSGHDYWLESFDGGQAIRLTFVKRNDPPEKYPGNQDAYPGTQIQEVLRALIERGEYVNKQFPCDETEEAIANFARALWTLEKRHCGRHGQSDAMNIYDLEGVDLQEFCKTCGHIVCFCEVDES